MHGHDPLGQVLLERHLLDELRLWIHPLLVGQGTLSAVGDVLARLALFTELEVPRRDVRLQRKLELAEPATPAPLSEHRTDRRPAGGDRHASMVSRPLE
jgi:hypothetical protein